MTAPESRETFLAPLRQRAGKDSLASWVLIGVRWVGLRFCMRAAVRQCSSQARQSRPVLRPPAHTGSGGDRSKARAARQSLRS